MRTSRRAALSLMTLAAVLLLIGVGCGQRQPPPPEPASRASVPKDISIMEGMEPLDEASWSIITLKDGRRRLESRWTTTALFDKVVYWYVDDFGKKGLATHTLEKGDTVKIFWGLADTINFADQSATRSITVQKTQVDGKTIVTMELDLPPR